MTKSSQPSDRKGPDLRGHGVEFMVIGGQAAVLLGVTQLEAIQRLRQEDKK